MCGVIAGLVTTGVGVGFLVAVFVVYYNVIPSAIETAVLDQTILRTDTEQWERFEETPFPIKFSVYFFNITNPDEVLAGGGPVVNELGPYSFKLYMKRIIEDVANDTVTYRRQEFLEFDTEASFPRTEQDDVTIANVPYLAILQIAETQFPSLMGALNLAINNVFGSDKSGPIATYKVDELLLKGYKLCQQPGLIGGIACAQIRNIGGSAKNMEVMDDGTILFSLIRYKQVVTELYEASRGLRDFADLGALSSFDESPTLHFWPERDGGEYPNLEGDGYCNKIQGTDSFIFHPFIDKEKSLFALNTDICRSVELHFQGESSYADIPTYKFGIGSNFLANEEQCFCLNQTRGITRDDGCLLQGATELISCTGGPLVLTSPHFLFADEVYRRGVVGLTPDEEKHSIAIELEPYTGTPLKGAKRGQFSAFMRPINGIPATQQLTTTLTPIFWIEEALELPEQYVQQIKDELIANLKLVDILLPILFALAAVVLAAGLGITGGYWYKRNKNAKVDNTEPPPNTSNAHLRNGVAET